MTAARIWEPGGGTSLAVSETTFWSPELYQIFGLDPAQPLPGWEERRKFYTPESLGRLEAASVRALETGESFCVQLDACRSDGSILNLEGRGSVGRDDSGAPTCLHGVVLDRTEERRAEAALRASEELFASAFKYAAIGMALVALDGRWMRVNRALCQMLGFSEAELLTGTFQEITHPDDLEADLENVRALLAGEIETYRMEKRYRHRDGRIIWAILSVSLVRDAGSRPLHFISQIQDISERKRAEAERDRFFWLSLDLLCIAGLDGYFKQVNPAWVRTLGWSESELLAVPVIDFLHPDDREATLRARDALTNGRPLVDLENCYRCKDGSYRWLSWQSFALPDEGTVFAVARDVTERRIAQEQLRSVAERLELATRAAGVGIWDWDIVEDRVVWDDVMCRLYCLEGSEGDLDFEFWTSRVHPEDRASQAEYVRKLLAGGKGGETEFRMLWSDGSVRYIQASAVVQRDDSGWPTRMVGTNWDITARKEGEREMLRAREEAEAANEAKSQFLAMMSHEIRTPMNAVIGFGDLLRRTPLNAEQRDFVASIQKGGASLTREVRRREAADSRRRQYIIAQSACARKDDAAKCREAGMDAHLGKPITLATLAAVLAIPAVTK